MISIAAAIFSAIAVLVSIFGSYFSWQTKSSDLEARFVDRAHEINNGFAQYGVKSPFAALLGIRDEDDKYAGKAALLFDQLNLYKDIFDNQRLLPASRIIRARKWAQTIFSPWIYGDRDLQRTFELIVESTDGNDPAFIEELQRYVQAPAIALTQAVTMPNLVHFEVEQLGGGMARVMLGKQPRTWDWKLVSDRGETIARGPYSFESEQECLASIALVQMIDQKTPIRSKVN